MTLEIVSLVALMLASVPALNVALNLLFYRPAPRCRRRDGQPPGVSVLIPARDEEANIRTAAGCVLSNDASNLELIVIDDHSSDRTADVVAEVIAEDPRVRLLRAPSLPREWGGKPHSCFTGAQQAAGEYLIFIDADVTLKPDAIQRLVAFMQRTKADLASGIPRQSTQTLAEQLVVPLIHFILLGFLPMMGMRWTRKAAFAAGCGQLLVVRRDAYEKVGGHQAVRATRHDGLALPRAFRKSGLKTELVDATDLATCRMYRSAREVWEGFAKNATEGMASPTAIVPWTILLLGGQVLPPLLWLTAWMTNQGQPTLAAAASATALAFITRLFLTWRFNQSVLGALLHPIGVLTMVAVQWYALVRQTLGRPLAWKGRT